MFSLMTHPRTLLNTNSVCSTLLRPRALGGIHRCLTLLAVSGVAGSDDGGVEDPTNAAADAAALSAR